MEQPLIPIPGDIFTQGGAVRGLQALHLEPFTPDSRPQSLHLSQGLCLPECPPLVHQLPLVGNHGAQGHCPPGANSLREKVSCLVSSSEEWSLGSPRAGRQCRGGLWREAGSGPLVWAVKVRWPGGLSGRGTARRKEEKKK